MKKAFTIIESLVVIAVIAILSTALVPLIGIYGPPARLSGDSKTLLASLRKAQQFSMSTEKRYGIRFYMSSREYRIFVKEFDEGEGTYVYTDTETIKLSTGINFDTIVINGVNQASNCEVYFDAFGSPKDTEAQHTDAQIKIKNSKNEILTVDIKKNTGYVKIT